jgi:hypothetical protein
LLLRTQRGLRGLQNQFDTGEAFFKWRTGSRYPLNGGRCWLDVLAFLMPHENRGIRPMGYVSLDFADD